MTELVPYEQVLERQLRNPEFRAEWERLAPARAVANRLVLYRAEQNLSQAALGRRLGLSQPAVARLEAADHLPSLDTLVRIAERLGLEIVVEIVPPARHQNGHERGLPPAVTTHASTSGGAELTVAIR
ncbi:MAG: helix-turn-helix transcriptional regulator [Thermomicrobiales bacterium]